MMFATLRPALRTALSECPTGSGCSCPSSRMLNLNLAARTRAFSASARASGTAGDCPTGQGCGCSSNARPTITFGPGDCPTGQGCGCSSNGRTAQIKTPVSSALYARGLAPPGDCPTGSGCGCN